MLGLPLWFLGLVHPAAPPGGSTPGRWDVGCCSRGMVDLHEAMDNTQEAGKVAGEGGKLGEVGVGTGKG